MRSCRHGSSTIVAIAICRSHEGEDEDDAITSSST
jgi:hypothetical protein